jgi:hypothetical protein
MRLFEQELPVVIDSGQFDSGRMANWIDKGLLGDSLAHVLAHDAFQGPSLHPPSRNPTPLPLPATHSEKAPDAFSSPRGR